MHPNFLFKQSVFLFNRIANRLQTQMQKWQFFFVQIRMINSVLGIRSDESGMRSRNDSTILTPLISKNLRYAHLNLFCRALRSGILTKYLESDSDGMNSENNQKTSSTKYICIIWLFRKILGFHLVLWIVRTSKNKPWWTQFGILLPAICLQLVFQFLPDFPCVLLVICL